MRHIHVHFLASVLVLHLNVSLLLHPRQHVVESLSLHDNRPVGRRQWFTDTNEQLRLLTGVGTLTVTSFVTSPTNAVANAYGDNVNTDELPSFLRDYTALAPLGGTDVTDANQKKKTTGLSLEDLALRLANDLTNGSSGQGGYFLTGDLSLDIFRDDCVFEDPTNRVASLIKYQNALRILFDPNRSTVQLLPPGLTVDPSTNTITGRLRSRGYLQLPWKPYVTAYETTIKYTVGDDDGLIARQEQKWSKSASQALQETFTPSITGPPPQSTLQPSSTEPLPVTQLFDCINGRRPYEFSPEERLEIQDLITDIVSLSTSKSQSFQASLLPGKWILAYLQPGPNGETIDRRIPFFPDFPFNDNFQAFTTTNTVVNTGELFGPWAYVTVSGSLQEEDPTTNQVPKRLQANIDGGKLCCAGGGDRQGEENMCFELPIRGEGLFDSLYLGERLRIGQNINGGGARIVQIRID